MFILWQVSFPGSSAGKESACNAGDPGLIPGSGRSGEGIGHPFQYSWAALVAQMVKNLTAMRETWVRPLGWENPLEESMATHSSILAWRIPWTEEPGRLQFMESQRVGDDERLSTAHCVKWCFIKIVCNFKARSRSVLVVSFLCSSTSLLNRMHFSRAE